MNIKKNRIGLGTFPLASVFTRVTKKQAEGIVKTFLDNGGYYIDSAPLYGFGKVEELLGRVLRQYSRNKYFIITKCGYIDVVGKSFQTVKKSCKYKDVIRECEKSLERLKVDSIDLYFVHSPDPTTPFDETMDALEKLQKDGKIREIGVSNVNLEELKGYNKKGKIEYIQNRFSLINRSINEKFERYLVKNNIMLIPYQPIERSQLSDRVSSEYNFRKGDLRIGRTDWEDVPFTVITKWVQKYIAPIAKEKGVAVEQLVMAWELQQKYVGFVIPGATSEKQVLTNSASDKVTLSKSNILKIGKAYYALEKMIKTKFSKTVREFRGLNEKYY